MKIPLYFWPQRGPRLGKFSICIPPPPSREDPPQTFRVEGAAPSKKKVSAIAANAIAKPETQARSWVLVLRGGPSRGGGVNPTLAALTLTLWTQARRKQYKTCVGRNG